MGIRLPLKGILDSDIAGEVGAGSVAGGIAKTFVIPQDTDNVVVKLTASVSGGGVSAIFQTSDDGGTTWYDVARTSVVSNTSGEANADWLSVPVISSGINPIVKSTANVGSILGGTIGNAAASALSQRQVSGMPILGQVNRVFLVLASGVSATALARVRVFVNSQTAR